MKSLMLGILMTGLSIQTYAQDVVFKAKLDKEDLPTVVLEAVETDFPDYTVTEYAALPVELVDEDIFVNTDISPDAKYDTYQLVLKQGNGNTMEAAYDMDGKLIETLEHLKNVTPPSAVRNSIASAFPGWTIEKDTFKMVHYSGKNAKERYKLILGKKNDKMKVYTDQNGTILKVS